MLARYMLSSYVRLSVTLSVCMYVCLFVTSRQNNIKCRTIRLTTIYDGSPARLALVQDKRSTIHHTRVHDVILLIAR